MKRLLVVLACCVWPAGAWAQSLPLSQLDRFERQLEQIQRESRQRIDDSIPPDERALFDYGAYYTFSYLSLDDTVGHNHVLRQHELVGYARLNLDGAHELFARARAGFNDFNRGDSFDGKGDDWQSFTLERFHYRFDLKRAMEAYQGKSIEGNITFQGGRQLVVWANGLTLSDTIDGGVASLSTGPFTLDLLAGVTWNKDVDFDISRPDFRDDTHRGLYGGMLSVAAGTSRLFAFGLVQRDYNGSETSTTSGVTTRFDYDSYYIGIGASGAINDNLRYGVELVHEGGSTLSNSFDPVTGSQLTQTRDDIRAFALDGRLDYSFADANRSRFSAEFILATGDPDRLAASTTLGGNRSGTNDTAFNAQGLLNTGLAFGPSVSNLLMLRVGATTFPAPQSDRFRQLQLGADFFVFGKFRSDAPIDEPTADERYLGVETDLFLSWQITSDITLSVRYGIFFPGDAILGDGSARNFLYAGVTYAF
jgi:hypothetical protein